MTRRDGARRRAGGSGRGRVGRGPTRAVLFVALGLVGAFVASAVAGLWSDAPTESGLQAPGVEVDDPASIRVEVLNGAGAPGLARDATHVLRARGFDVVYFGNAGRFDHVRSVVLDRVGDTLGARAVAASLGIDSVAAAPDRTLMLDVSVVLGEDWPPAPARDPGWTARLRGLVDDAGAVDRAGNDSAGGG